MYQIWYYKYNDHKAKNLLSIYSNHQSIMLLPNGVGLTNVSYKTFCRNDLSIKESNNIYLCLANCE